MDRNKLWKILKEMGNTRPPDLPPENCQEATVRMLYGATDQLGIEKEEDKFVYVTLFYLTYMQSTSCKMPGSMNHHMESRLRGEISITSDLQVTPLLWLRKQRGTKETLIEGGRGE